MEFDSLKKFIKHVNGKTYDYDYRKKKEVLVSIILEYEGEKNTIIDQHDRKAVSRIKEFVKFNPVDKVIVEAYVDGELIPYYFDMKNEKKREKTGKNEEIQDSTTRKTEKKQEIPTFNGFGEAEVENLIAKRLAEEKTRMELIDLRDKVQKKDQKIAKLKENIGELEGKLEEAANVQEELENKIKLKENIRYYAGFAGDVLESIGLDKKKLRQPLAGLLQEEEQNPTKQIEQASTDESGIVEEGVETDESNIGAEEVVSMIHEFLKRTDNETLGYLYEVLVYIEKDKSVAKDLFTYLSQQQKAE